MIQPFIRHNNYFLIICIEPCTPPAECTVSDDIVFAQAHQIHVDVTFIARIIIYNRTVFQVKVLPYPLGII